jgi:tetratricopeptide (TPR) repeat protein
MLFNVLPIIIFFGSLVIVIGLVLRRLPDISTIRVDTIAEAKVATTKRLLLLTRLRRKAIKAAESFWAGTLIRRQSLQVWLITLTQKLSEFEKKHRSKKLKADVNPESIEGMLGRADKLRSGQELKPAEELYLEVIRNDHRNAAAYFGLGLLYEQMEELAQARQAYEYAARLQKDNPDVWLAIARVATEENRHSETRAALERALALSPKSAEIAIMLGDVDLTGSDYQSAIKSFGAAVELEPSNPRYLDRLLEACILAGEKRMAVETLRRLTEVNPENQKLGELRERLATMGSKARKKILTTVE